MNEYVNFLDETTINKQVFPEALNGLTDSNSAIREATIKAMVQMAPRLKPDKIEYVFNLYRRMCVCNGLRV